MYFWDADQLEGIFQDFGRIENILKISYSEETHLSSYVVIFTDALDALNAFEQIEEDDYCFRIEYYNLLELIEEELDTMSAISDDQDYYGEEDIFNQSLIDEHFNYEFDSDAETVTSVHSEDEYYEINQKDSSEDSSNPSSNDFNPISKSTKLFGSNRSVRSNSNKKKTGRNCLRELTLTFEAVSKQETDQNYKYTTA